MILTLLPAMLAIGLGTTTSEEGSGREAIRRAIMEYYHEGHVRSDPALFEPILHPEWRLFYLDEQGQLGIVDRDAYLAAYGPEKRDPRLRWETKIHYIDVDGDLAAAKLWIGNQDLAFVDYFNLMRLDGRWWIVHKISRKADPR